MKKCLFLFCVMAFAVSCANTDPTTGGGGGGIVIEKPVIPATDNFYDEVLAHLAHGGKHDDIYDEYGGTWFFEAVYLNALASANLLIEEGANVNYKWAYDYDVPALAYASFCGYTDMVQLLLSAGANITATNSDGCTSLIFASIRGCIDTVKLLLSAGAKINEYSDYSNTSVMLASWYGHDDVVKYLISAGATK